MLQASSIVIAVADDAFVHPEPGTTAGDHLAGGLIPIAIALSATWAYPHLRSGTRTVSSAQIEAEGGLTVDETRLVVLNFGLPAPDPQEPYFTVAEADALVRFGSLREIWPPAVYLQIARVYGQASLKSPRLRSTCFGFASSRPCAAGAADRRAPGRRCGRSSGSFCHPLTRCCLACTGGASRPGSPRRPCARLRSELKTACCQALSK